jgi:hypothetical protein
VVEFKQPTFLTTPFCSDKGAPSLITFPHCSLHGRRHVAIRWSDRARMPWPIRRRKLLPFRFLQQQSQRTIEDLSDVATRH